MVDYLQLMRGTRKFENRVLEISEITQGLKSIAKELDVPVLALSQLSRAVEQREDKRPQLSDLRESGTIEQDSDVVMFIYRQEYYEERAEPKSSGTETSVAFTERYIKWQENLEQCKNLADIIVAKQRHGPIGSLQLFFDSKLTKFSNYTDDSNSLHKIKLVPLIKNASSILLINLGGNKENYNFLKKAFKSEIGISIKANAYGLGTKKICKTFIDQGCNTFFVATAQEGLEIIKIKKSKYLCIEW